ncbi:MAG: amino acid permease, partial [Chlamydiia bacterium]|nr:amino acid permease [Chlamydiia bacterium]
MSGLTRGIIIPNLTMMMGMILFLRLGLIVGHLGLVGVLVVIGISLVLMLITAYAIAMIATNMEVGGGGIYYLVSRSLGVEVGGAIGLSLVFSQTMTLTLCVTGLAYSLRSLYPFLPQRELEMGVLVWVTGLVLISTALVFRARGAVFCLLMLAVASIFFSRHPYPYPKVEELSNLFQNGMTFWEGFALLFPTFTGIEGAMALTHRLKDPAQALSRGNLITYAIAGTLFVSLSFYLYTTFPAEVLQADPMVLFHASRVAPLLYLGLWGMILSNAMGCLLGASSMLQVVAVDKIVPQFLGKTFGPSQEPRIAMVTIALIAGIAAFLTSIDQIIPILTMICLLAYMTLNLVAGLAQWIKPPSWRPLVTFPWPLCLFGALLALILMLMIDVVWTLVPISLLLGITLFLKMRSISTSFHDLRSSIIFFFSRLAIYHLSTHEDHPHTWHPQLLVLATNPIQQRAMIHFANRITRTSGLLSLVSLLPENWKDPEELPRTKRILEEYVRKEGIDALVDCVTTPSPEEQSQQLICSYGLGPLQPNTIVLPFSDDTLPLIDTCGQERKNLLLFHEHPTLPLAFIDAKKIDLWWDQETQSSFELALSYIHALTADYRWRQAKVTLFAVVPNKQTKKHVEKNFKAFIKESRVRLKLKILIAPSLSPSLIEKHSPKNHLLFLPTTPVRLTFHPTSRTFCYVLCFDEINHRE